MTTNSEPLECPNKQEINKPCVNQGFHLPWLNIKLEDWTITVKSWSRMGH